MDQQSTGTPTAPNPSVQPDFSPPSTPLVTNSKPKNHIFIWIMAGLTILGIGITVGLFLGKTLKNPFTPKQSISSYEQCLEAKNSILQESYPATCITANGKRFTQPLTDEEKQNLLPPDQSVESTGSTATANWKTYSFSDGSFKHPNSWAEKPILIRGSGFTQEIKDKEGLYLLTLFTQGNYSQITGKPYTTLEEFIGPPPNILETLTIDGQQGGRILPRAGSENKNAIVFFSKDKKTIYTIELDTGSSTLADPQVTEESVKTGQELFDQILSTFRFVDPPSVNPVSCGGWNTGGSIECTCIGKLIKPTCPPNTICDAIDYQCEGQCGQCCWRGVAENNQYPKCQN
ncbi:hypothetical protein A2973_04530 [Candidatus Gottesmanbacteria bacterium RIFCSPLOWO2_01_FULL_49_10]|uniref:Uncharacterized protein n=1 Tax=Candidatus Gottesmanbacteria bacterium RIFCSPLOWO2_01_FULL_49_10 TaxID=1798396 RepID=A0A1F6AX09_9BACT|nr:MAG: hypothetical protein UY10_C0009G0017 [Microgenomates group bacterium GW2011_GWA2_47_8]OGG28857.1 MAG: hypothetical protein A2973_04530 [Candidatus Gottesmanbacteria bacterium RIFCSPLOWO2_01_FULL_49_10]